MSKLFVLTLLLILMLPADSQAARLHTIGFETQSFIAGEEFTSVGLGAGHGGPNGWSHSGAGSFYNHAVTAAFSWLGNVFRADGSTSKVYARCYVYIVSLPATNPAELCSFWDSVAVARRASVVVTSGGVAQLLAASTQVGSDSSALPLNQWIMIELSSEGTGAADNDIEGKIDGVSFASSATATVGDFNAVYIGTPNASTAHEIYWDDLAVNDTATTKGSTQTGYPGAGNITYFKPTAAGDTAATLGTFADIDEMNPDDVTSFIDLDTLASVAFYNVSNYTAASTTGIEYYFDASDAGPTDTGGHFTDEANIFDGSKTTYGYASNVSSFLEATGTNAPASGPTIQSVRVGLLASTTALGASDILFFDTKYSGTSLGLTGWNKAAGEFQVLTVSSGGWTWDKVQALEIEITFDSSIRTDFRQVVVIVETGMDSYDTINLIDMGVRAREEASAATSFQFGVKSQASGLVASSTAQDAGDTTWRTNQTGTTAMTNRMATTTDPQSNGAWTPTLLDTMQMGVGSLDDDNIDISTLWVAVEYSEGSPPSTGIRPNPIIWWD